MKNLILLVLILGGSFVKGQEADFKKYTKLFASYFGKVEGHYQFTVPTYPDTIRLFWSDSIIEISSGIVDVTEVVVLAVISPKDYGYISINGLEVYLPTKYENKQKAVLQTLSEVWDFLSNLENSGIYGKKIDSLSFLVLQKYEAISFKDCSSDPRCDLFAMMYESVLPEKLIKVKYGELSPNWEYTILLLEDNTLWLYMDSVSDFLEIHFRNNVAEEVKFSANGDVSYGYSGYHKFADKSMKISSPEADTDDWGVSYERSQVSLSEFCKELSFFINSKF